MSTPSTISKRVTVIEYRPPNGTPVECATLVEAEALRAARGGTVRTFAKKIEVAAQYQVRDADGNALGAPYDSARAASVAAKYTPGATIHLIEP